ncbi:MAG: YicC/YloC family endoribonuclease [Pseudomonadota bacterium]
MKNNHLFSMTAYARHQVDTPVGSAVWELRTVNHRFLDVSIHLPEDARHLEFGAREAVRRSIRRGKLDATLKLTSNRNKAQLEIDRPVLLQLLATVEQIRRDAPEFGALDPLELLRWPGVVIDDTSASEETDGLLLAAFEAALEQLAGSRAREGEALRETIASRLDEIDRLTTALELLASEVVPALEKRLRERVVRLSIEVPPDRLAQEVVMAAGRADVAEELDRLRTHVVEARRALDAPGPHGRRLDFLTQELNREANTLASKAIAATSAARAVDLKLAIEQIREQVQNVE